MNREQIQTAAAGPVELPSQKRNGLPLNSDGSRLPPLPRINGMPIMFEDDEEGDLGESNPHVVTDEILHVCLGAYLAPRPQYQVFSNMNLYYLRDEEKPEELNGDPYVSPNTMVVEPYRRLGKDVTSYKIGRDGPAPLLTGEVLSARSAQQRDLGKKPEIYAQIGVQEYILVDTTGRFLAERLLLKRLQANGTWQDERDPDGGITSRLGFRIIIDSDGEIRLVDANTGWRLIRPDEAEQQALLRRQAEAEAAALRAQLEEFKRKGQ